MYTAIFGVEVIFVTAVRYGSGFEQLGSLDRRPLRSPGGTRTQQRSKPTSVCMYIGMPKPGTRGTETPYTIPTVQDWCLPDATMGTACYPSVLLSGSCGCTCSSFPDDKDPSGLPCCAKPGIQASEKHIVYPGVTAASWAGQTLCLQLCPPLLWNKQARVHTAWLLSPQRTTYS